MLEKIWNKLKNCWKSRTVWIGSIMTFLSAVQANMVDLAPALDPKHYAMAMFGLSMAQVFLRFDTSKSLEDK